MRTAGRQRGERDEAPGEAVAGIDRPPLGRVRRENRPCQRIGDGGAGDAFEQAQQHRLQRRVDEIEPVEQQDEGGPRHDRDGRRDQRGPARPRRLAEGRRRGRRGPALQHPPRQQQRRRRGEQDQRRQQQEHDAVAIVEPAGDIGGAVDEERLRGAEGRRRVGDHIAPQRRREQSGALQEQRPCEKGALTGDDFHEGLLGLPRQSPGAFGGGVGFVEQFLLFGALGLARAVAAETAAAAAAAAALAAFTSAGFAAGSGALPGAGAAGGAGRASPGLSSFGRGGASGGASSFSRASMAAIRGVRPSAMAARSVGKGATRSRSNFRLAADCRGSDSRCATSSSVARGAIEAGVGLGDGRRRLVGGGGGGRKEADRKKQSGKQADHRAAQGGVPKFFSQKADGCGFLWARRSLALSPGIIVQGAETVAQAPAAVLLEDMIAVDRTLPKPPGMSRT